MLIPDYVETATRLPVIYSIPIEMLSDALIKCLIQFN